MHIHTRRDVALFVFGISLMACAMAGLSDIVTFGPRDLGVAVVSGQITALLCAVPISTFVGLRLRLLNQTQRQLEQMVHHDDLTGLLTRKRFFELLDGGAAPAGALVLIDIDHFKPVNDVHGHQVGDQALRHIARVLTSNCRPGDMLCRYGGEEFIVFLAGVNRDDALILSERLRRAVEETPLVTPDICLVMTASFGCAPRPQAASLGKVLKDADDALYRAKRAGRNRISLAWAAPRAGIPATRNLVAAGARFGAFDGQAA